jgi:AcrR family transcriptional regulator
MPTERSWPESLADSAASRRGAVPRNRAQEERRAALLDAAEGLFADKGLLQTGLQEIGAAVGLAPYAVRAQFGNREMVLEAVLDRHMDRLIDRLGAYRAHEEAADPGERLAGAIGDLLDLLSAYRAGQRVHVAAVAEASPHLARSLKLRQRHVVHFYAGLIARAVPEAEGRTELAMPAALSLMGMACLHVLWFRERRAEPGGVRAAARAHGDRRGARRGRGSGVGGLE